MSFQTYTRPRRAAVSPAARLSGGPVTRAIRALRPNEMPTWEIREAEMRRQEVADLAALRRRVAKAVAQGIDFLDATGGDPESEPNLGSPEVKLPDVYAKTATGRKTAKLPSEVFAQGQGDDLEVDADIERDAGEEAEEENEHGADDDRGEDSLGSLGGTAAAIGHSQLNWSGGGGFDAEAVDEDGGDIQDEPHDAEEDAGFDDGAGEHSLGWCENVGQLALGPNTADGDATALERHGAGFLRSGHEDDEDSHDREGGSTDDNGIADTEGWNEQRSRYLRKGGDIARVGGAF